MPHRTTENTMALLGGALLGAAAMYLLDPQAGRSRRESLSETAGDAFRAAGETVAPAFATLGDRARDISQRLADRAQSIGSGLSDRASDATDRAIRDRTARPRGAESRQISRAGRRACLGPGEGTLEAPWLGP